MGGRARARGEREPKGKTKSAIILFLAEKGESTFTDIRAYLKESYHIKSSKDIKLHLDDLASDDRLALIQKIPHGNGFANSYRIREGFDSLKRLHGFLNQQEFVPALMRTKYFIDYTATLDFDTKARTNIVRNSMLELYEGMLDDNGHEKIVSLLSDIDDADRIAMTEWMIRVRANDRDDILSGSFLAMVDLLKEGNIDLLGGIFMGIMSLIKVSGNKSDLEGFVALMSDLSLSEEQHKMVSAARRLSPGALDYLLNSSKNNRMFPPNVFLAYVFSLILQTPGKDYAPDRLPPVDFGKYRRYAAAVPTFYKFSPIAMIIRSLFIADMVHGRLIEKEIPEETLRLIFSD